MTTFDRSLRLTVVGWALFACFGVLVALGPDSLANGAVFSAIGIAMGLWVWFRRSRPALAVSLVLGVLHSLEQVAYSAADISDSDWTRLAADAGAIVVGLAIVVGAFMGLRAARRARSAVPAASNA